MPAQKMIRPLFVALFSLSLQLCSAVAPSGNVTVTFDAATAPVWDLTGTVNVNQAINGSGGTQVPISFDLPLSLAANGRLTSPGGPVLLTVGDSAVASDITASGRVSGGGTSTKVSIAVHLSGQDVIAGVSTRFNIHINYNLKVDPATMSLVGTGRGNAKFSDLKAGGSINSTVSIPLPAGTDGAWSAQMNILPVSGLTGSGAFVLSNGRSLPTTLSGSYSSKTDLSKIKLVGTGEGLGSSATLKISTTDLDSQVQTLQGRILGQTVKQ